MKRKICIFTAHYFPYLGGVESYTYNLAKALMDSGDEVTIITSNDLELPEFEIMDGIPVYRVPCFNFLKGRCPLLKPNRDFYKIHRKIKKVKFDLVLVNTRFYPHTLYGAWFARMQKTRCIILDHGTSHITVGNPAVDLAFSWIEHVITAAQKILCREFYGVSKACCHWLEHFHIKASGILYNAVNVEKISEATENPVRKFREEMGISEDTLMITYTGRLIKEKGIMNLIEAVENLSQEYKVCLMIAGDGEEMEAVQSHKSERIRPLGRLYFEEVAALLGESEIFCLPTEYPEGFPTSVLEAAAAGCYIITTDRGGSKELIVDNSYGRILKNPTPEHIQSAIEKAIAHPNKREAAARKAGNRVEELFTWKQTAKKVHALAKQNIGDKR